MIAFLLLLAAIAIILLFYVLILDHITKKDLKAIMPKDRYEELEKLHNQLKNSYEDELKYYQKLWDDKNR